MTEWQVSQPQAERVGFNSDAAQSRPMVNWGPDEHVARGPVCRVINNQIVCDDIFSGTASAKAERPVSFSLQYNDAFRGIVGLQVAMGVAPDTQAGRVSEKTPPLYSSIAPQLGTDQYSYNQDSRVTPRPPVPNFGTFDAYGFNQGDKGNPGFIPPYIAPNGREIPQPPIPGPVRPIEVRPIEVPPHPVPLPPPDVQPGPNPSDVRPYPNPSDVQPCPNPYQPNPYQSGPCPNPYQPYPQYNPYQQHNPCFPGRRWYPGMITGRIIGRILGCR